MKFVIFNIAANLKTYNNTWIVVAPNTSYKLLNNDIVAFERSNITGKFVSNFALSA